MKQAFRAGRFRARTSTPRQPASAAHQFRKQPHRSPGGVRTAIRRAVEAATPGVIGFSRRFNDAIFAPAVDLCASLLNALLARLDWPARALPVPAGRRAMIESLEGRRLLSAAPTDYLGTVSMGADPNSGPFGALNETATLVGSNIVCQINGVYASFPASQVQLIKVWGGNTGGDTISIDHNITASALINCSSDGYDTVSGGGGADTISGWGGHNSITAGTGHDQISGNGGYNTLIGGTGGDTLCGNGGHNSIVGGSVNDSLSGSSSTDTIVPATGTLLVQNSGNPQPVSTYNSAPLNAIISAPFGLTAIAGTAVHVNATASALGSGTPLNSSFQWNFGDPSGEYNKLPGYNAAHIYTSPGTYTITLTLTSPTGAVSTASASVTVTADVRTKIYVSPSGSDSNNGLSPGAPVQSLARVQQLIANNTEILFQRGATFDMSTGLSIINSNVLLGAYGSGADPILLYNGPRNGSRMIGIVYPAVDVVVQDLVFDSIFNSDYSGDGVPYAVVTGNLNNTILRCTFYNVCDAVNAGTSGDGVLVQDCSSPSTTALRGYFLYMTGSDIVAMGNYVANSDQEHLIRGDATRVLIAYNDLTNIQFVPGVPAKGDIVIAQGEFAYVYHNALHYGGGVSVGPIDNDSTASLSDTTAQFNWAVFNDNQIAGYINVQPAAIHTLFSHNVIWAGDATAFSVAGYDSTYNRIVSDLEIIHNTVLDNGTNGMFIELYGPASGVVLDNNLWLAPSLQYGIYNSVAVYINDVNTASFSQISDNVWPAGSYQYSYGGQFYLGTSPQVTSDYFSIQQWYADGDIGDVLANVTVNQAAYQYSTTIDNAGTNLT